MSYQVIARKYRPQRFEDVVGQEHVTTTLANAIRSGRIAHAYLFCGPRGTGKTTVARIFAKALNCTDGPSAVFQEDDPRCREITEGRSLDVLEIDGASNNGVEQVRELRETARFAPAASRFKIYIIDEVHMLTPAAFNALLKTLEEPPAHVKFLFATTDPEKVLPTILSRCQRFDLRRIPNSLIVQHLREIARLEGVAISDAALQAIARGADGGMRDAESTLDQLISFCGDKIEESDVLSMFGLAAHDQILALSRAVLQSERAAVLHELDSLARSGKDLGRLLHDLLHHFRNLLVFQVANEDRTLIEASEAEGAELKAQLPLAPADAVTRILEVLTQAEGRLRDAASRKIFLEVTLLKAIQARNAISLDSVLQQLQALRGTAAESLVPPTPPPSPASPSSVPVHAASATTMVSGSTPPSTAPTRGASAGAATSLPVVASASSPVSSSPSPSRTASVAPADLAPMDPAAAWDQAVASASPMMRAALQAGVYQGFEKGVVTVGYPRAQDHHRTIAESDRTRKAVEARLAELGCPAILRFVSLADAPGDAMPPTPRTVTASGPSAPVAAASPRPPAPSGSSPHSGAVPSTGSPSTPARSRTAKAAPVKLDPAEFKNDPLIQEALEIFRGQLIEIRAADGTEPGAP